MGIANDLEIASAFWRGTNGQLVRRAAAYIKDLEHQLEELRINPAGQEQALLEERAQLLARIEELQPHGFIPWVGGPCPVTKGTRVEIRSRGNSDRVVRRHVCTAGVDCPSWYHSGNSGDIIGYTVVQEKTPS